MRFRNAPILAMVILAAILVGGCSSAPVAPSVTSQLSSKSNTDDLEFWHELATQPVATNDDAFHGLLLHLDGSDPAKDYDDRLRALKGRGLLSDNFHQPANSAVERGTIAVALVRSLNLKGGLTMRLFGASPRYAIRELEYRNLYPPSSERQLFSGAEFVGVIGRVEDFSEGDPADVPAKVLYVGGPQISPPTTQPVADGDTTEQPLMLSTAANFSLADPTTEQAASQPAPLKLPEGPLKLKITGVRGNAQFRNPPDEDWKKAEKDQALVEGSELRTGPKSAVQLQIVPDQTVTIDRLGVLKIDRAALASGKFVTSVSMQYGRTRYDIDAANREYDATVRSPNSTLGIRGTHVSLLDQRPFPPEAVSLTGTAQFQTIHRQLVALGKKGQGKTKIQAGQTSAAELSLQQAVVDPTSSLSRTQSEQDLIASVISRGATETFDRDLGIPVITNLTPPQSEAEIASQGFLLGRLTFVLTWNQNVNMNLAVSTPSTSQVPGGELLFVQPGLTQTPSGGRIPFDDRGGSKGGVEIGYWNTNIPTGAIGVAAVNEGSISTQSTIRVFLDGKRQLSLTEQGFIPDGPTQPQTVRPGEPNVDFYDIELDDSSQAPSAAHVKASKPPANAGKPQFVGPMPMIAPTKTKR